MNELVSVIIPTYGGAEYLKRCVDSVLAQTYTNIEIIVVDDNGFNTPNHLKTSKVMEEYRNVPSVKYVCHEVNINGSAARNTGFKNSKGDYIALLDDDDTFLPNNIEEHIKVLTQLPSEYALTYCNGIDEFVDSGRSIIMKHTFTGQDPYKIMMHIVTISSTSIVIRRKAWEELGGFDESFRRHQDWEFTARVMFNYKVYALPNIGYKRYRIQRNLPTDVELRKKYVEHYLNSLMPYIQTLPKRQQKDILICNRLVGCKTYLQKKQICNFFAEYISIKPGYRGTVFLISFLKEKISSEIKCKLKQLFNS